MKRLLILALTLALVPSTASLAQERPGAPDLARVTAGTYQVDANHTQVIWTVDHLGISPLSGMFGKIGGTLVIDPKAPDAAKLDITLPMAGLTVTSVPFAQDLASAEFFDTATFPSASFTSTRVTANGATARIEGELSLHGMTRPVVLEASFVGAGFNPMHKAEEIGFTATGTLKRSEFGLGAAVPAVSDEVQLRIVGAFSKRP